MGVLLFQNPSAENPGVKHEPPQSQVRSKVKKVPELPESYTNVKPACISKNPNTPVKQGRIGMYLVKLAGPLSS